MFDKGIYLADMSSKSANYCCPYNSGGQALLLLCEAELGNPMQVLTDASYNAGTTAAQNGNIATWGQGLTAPRGLKDAGSLHPALAGTKMVRGQKKRHWTATNLFIARHEGEPRRDQRQWRLLAVQRVHLLQRRSGALALPVACEDVSHVYTWHSIQGRHSRILSEKPWEALRFLCGLLNTLEQGASMEGEVMEGRETNRTYGLH